MNRRILLVGLAHNIPVFSGIEVRKELVVLELDDNLREMTFRNESLDKLRASALATGRLRPLIVDGARKVLECKTTVTEILRVARSAEAGNASANQPATT